MKKWFMAGLAALCLLALSGCAGCDGGEKIDYNLVFVNGSDAKIVEVVVAVSYTHLTLPTIEP